MRNPRRDDDRGQTLLLAPIAVLIVVVLGAVTLEVASLHLQQRRLDDLADTVANDAATVGFDVQTFRQSGDITIDLGVANQVAADSISMSSLPETAMTSLGLPAPDMVELDLSYEYQFILGRSIFGVTTELTATGRATLVPSL